MPVGSAQIKVGLDQAHFVADRAGQRRGAGVVQDDAGTLVQPAQLLAQLGDAGGTGGGSGSAGPPQRPGRSELEES